MLNLVLGTCQYLHGERCNVLCRRVVILKTVGLPENLLVRLAMGRGPSPRLVLGRVTTIARSKSGHDNCDRVCRSKRVVTIVTGCAGARGSPQLRSCAQLTESLQQSQSNSDWPGSCDNWEA